MNALNTNIYERVSKSLLDDPRTSKAVIDIVTQQGMITLTGKVDSEEVRQAAEEIARNQPGVITVVNELKVE